MDQEPEIPLADESEVPVESLQNPPKPAQPLPRVTQKFPDALFFQCSFEKYNILDADSAEEVDDKARLISQILELQSTLEELSQRADSVKEESFKLRSENEVLGQYIENLMAASSVFQSASPKGKSKY
ncbi:short coiled-coil protein A family protein [Trichinella nativa]|uniref:Short coiled-coil protein A family protein n=2 Tax=Trichinella TaxID=6333 RepID=A0A1Y3EF39_9BILA|nr:Short coiled-coil -like protein [Trichinella murrelli]OUC43744.1 short coiled-coil protein A family protein [Trichinella nativa]